MPGIEMSPMHQRLRFIAQSESGLFTFRELCERFGISRNTGYRWLLRYRSDGVEGLEDRSSAPHSCPHRTPPDVVERILQAKRLRPLWGPKKLIAQLRSQHPDAPWPSVSTAGGILQRHGLVRKRRCRRRLVDPPRARTEAERPNHVWTVDFKGEFRLGNGRYCYPLTVVDDYSRFLVGCHGFYSTRLEGVEPVFGHLFRLYGLPEIIRSDNGTPFASIGLGALSRLAIGWLHLGIQLERIDRGCPQQNGRHERLHRTLKDATTRPAARHLRAQQLRFDAFREDYNHVRPHEALGQIPPATRYHPSPTSRLRRQPFCYPAHFEPRKVDHKGSISFNGKRYFLALPLQRETVGLEPLQESLWSIHLGTTLLGRLNESTGQIVG